MSSRRLRAEALLKEAKESFYKESLKQTINDRKSEASDNSRSVSRGALRRAHRAKVDKE